MHTQRAKAPCVHGDVYIDGNPPMPSASDCERIKEALSDPDVAKYVEEFNRYLGERQILQVPPKMKALETRGEQVVPFLIQCLQSHDLTVRRGAWLALVKITNQDYGGLEFFKAAADPAELLKNTYRMWVSWWNKHCRLDRFAWLAEAIHLHDKRAVVSIIDLSGSKDPRLPEVLRTALREDELRPYAITALAESGCQDGFRLLFAEVQRQPAGDRRVQRDLLASLSPTDVAEKWLSPEGEDLTGFARWLQENGPYLYFDSKTKRFAVDIEMRRLRVQTRDRDTR